MRLCSASSRRAFLELARSDICCSSATGLCVQLPPQHRIELAEQAGRVGDPSSTRGSAASAPSRRCAGATNWPSVRASLTIGASCAPAVSSMPHVVGVNTRGSAVCTTSTPCSRPRSIDRHAEERVVRILAGLAEVLEPGMRGGIVDDLRPQLLGDQPGEPFGEPHAHPADALGTQADRRREHEVGAVGLEQVDRTDVGVEPAR